MHRKRLTMHGPRALKSTVKHLGASTYRKPLTIGPMESLAKAPSEPPVRLRSRLQQGFDVASSKAVCSPVDKLVDARTLQPAHETPIRLHSGPAAPLPFPLI